MVGKRAVAVFSFVVLCLFALGPVVQVAQAQVDGWYSIYWNESVWNNRYPGNTVYLDFYLVDTGWLSGYGGVAQQAYANFTLSSLDLFTPWQTYAADDVPVGLCNGCGYFNEFDVLIPTTLQPGEVTFNLTFPGTYSDGGPFCADSGNICEDVITLQVDPNPSLLQDQVTSLQGTVTSLNSSVLSLTSQVSSLQTQLASANSNITMLQAQVATYQGQVSNLQTQLSAAYANATALQGTITTLQGQRSAADANGVALQQNLTPPLGQLQQAQSTLSSDSAQLSSLQSSLTISQSKDASDHSSLETLQNVYLPVGVAVPSLVAILFAVLYFRKRPA